MERVGPAIYTSPAGLPAAVLNDPLRRHKMGVRLLSCRQAWHCDTEIELNRGDIALGLFNDKTRVLFVCTENICRSPLAEGMMRHHLNHAGAARSVKVSSAGTRASQPGARPDQRAQRIAADAGFNLGRIKARRVTEKDLALSDMVLAMDHANIRGLIEICPPEHQHKISLLLSHDPGQSLVEVPDPYYGSYEGFVQVFQIIESAVVRLIPRIATFSQARKPAD